MQRDYYTQCITKVLQYIDNHLEDDLSVERLADIALFSKFHFHRIFKAAIGETLAAYVSRRRLERAVLFFKRYPDLSVTDVALRVGFRSPEHFSRAFKEKFGLPPRAFRQSSPEAADSPKNSKIYQEVSEHSFYRIYEETRNQSEPPNNDASAHSQTRDQTFEVDVRELPSYRVATISEFFGTDGTALVAAYQTLIQWGESQGIVDRSTQRFAVSRDDIEVTPAEVYRLEFSISIPEGTRVDQPMVEGEIVGGSYALIHVQGDIYQVARAWDYLYKRWLPGSGWLPMDQPAIEIFLQGPEEIGWEAFNLQIGIPIVRGKNRQTGLR